jgi:divalent metal cation (Fe/Co/Zn/Cd) transporter
MQDHRNHMRAAWLISLQTVIWTVIASCLALSLGVASGSAALAAFGAIGFIDALGSIALVYHFRHGLRHDALSDRLESIAHRVVLVGLLAVGLGAIVGGIIRLIAGQGGSSNAGSVLAAVSLVMLSVLSARKISLARLVSSPALLADGRLSGVGAMQAAVTLFGTAMTRWLGWHWADAVAAALVGAVAITVAITSWTASRSNGPEIA